MITSRESDPSLLPTKRSRVAQFQGAQSHLYCCMSGGCMSAISCGLINVNGSNAVTSTHIYYSVHAISEAVQYGVSAGYMALLCVLWHTAPSLVSYHFM